VVGPKLRDLVQEKLSVGTTLQILVVGCGAFVVGSKTLEGWGLVSKAYVIICTSPPTSIVCGLRD
jgi:hypothetical protein